MFPTIDGSCRHLRSINFLCRQVQRQLAGMDGEWVFTLPIFNQLVKDKLLTETKFQTKNVMYEI